MNKSLKLADNIRELSENYINANGKIDDKEMSNDEGSVRNDNMVCTTHAHACHFCLTVRGFATGVANSWYLDEVRGWILGILSSLIIGNAIKN